MIIVWRKLLHYKGKAAPSQACSFLTERRFLLVVSGSSGPVVRNRNATGAKTALFLPAGISLSPPVTEEEKEGKGLPSRAPKRD